MAESSMDFLKRVQERISKHKWPNHRADEPDLMKDLDTLITEMASAAHHQYRKVDGDKDALRDTLKKEIQSGPTYQKIRGSIATYQKRHAAHLDEHEELKKIENAQGRRALFWRTTSTIAFATVIFFFYWLAGYVGVQLPLSRLGM